MPERPFSEGGREDLDAEKQKKVQMMNDLQPTGDLLSDIDTLAKIAGSSLYRYFTDSITGAQKVDPENPDAVYQFYMSPDSQQQLNQTYDDPVYSAHVEALKRILKACKRS